MNKHGSSPRGDRTALLLPVAQNLAHIQYQALEFVGESVVVRRMIAEELEGAFVLRWRRKVRGSMRPDERVALWLSGLGPRIGVFLWRSGLLPDVASCLEWNLEWNLEWKR